MKLVGPADGRGNKRTRVGRIRRGRSARAGRTNQAESGRGGQESERLSSDDRKFMSGKKIVNPEGKIVFGGIIDYTSVA